MSNHYDAEVAWSAYAETHEEVPDVNRAGFVAGFLAARGIEPYHDLLIVKDDA